MCRIQTFAKPKQIIDMAQVKSRRSVQRMLREIAFVLHMTRRVKNEILADKAAVKLHECEQSREHQPCAARP